MEISPGDLELKEGYFSFLIRKLKDNIKVNLKLVQLVIFKQN